MITVYAIVISALFMAAVVCLGYEHIGRGKAEEKAEQLERDLFDAEDLIASYRIEKANRDGVEAGRTTDAMYKSFLSQFSAGEQVTVMLRRDNAEYYAPKS
jgi:hypothetical protein